MKDMKMSDVFKLPLKNDSNDSSIIGADGRLIIQFASSKNNEWHDTVCVDDNEMKSIAHAINNHDRLQQENAELREALVLISLNSSFQANMPHEADLIENLLSKND